MTAILVTTPLEPSALKDFIAAQAEKGIRVDYHPELNVADRDGTPDEKIRRLLPEYDGLVVGSIAIGRETWEAWAKARPDGRLAVSRVGISTESLHVPEAEALGIAVMNTPLPRITPCANFLFQQIMKTFVGTEADRHARALEQNHFDDTQPLFLPDISTAKIAILGSGPIAASLVDRLRPFLNDPLNQVKLYSPRLGDHKAEGFSATRAASATDAVQDADIIVVAAGHTKDVVFGQKELDAIRTWRQANPGERAPVLVGISRKFHYDLPALAGAMQDGTLRAAALDSRASDFAGVKQEHPGLEPVTFTPGIAYRTLTAEQDATRDALENLSQYLGGGKLRNITRDDSLSALQASSRLAGEALAAEPSSVSTRTLRKDWLSFARAERKDIAQTRH